MEMMFGICWKETVDFVENQVLICVKLTFWESVEKKMLKSGNKCV